MTFEDLKQSLDDLAWKQQMASERYERNPDYGRELDRALEQELRDLARRLTPGLLDSLESQGYLEWALRLSPYVPGDSPSARGRRHLRDADRNVRFWAAEIAGSKVPTETQAKPTCKNRGNKSE